MQSTAQDLCEPAWCSSASSGVPCQPGLLTDLFQIQQEIWRKFGKHSLANAMPVLACVTGIQLPAHME